MATIRQRRPGAWEVRVFLGRDPISGKKRQRSQVVQGTKREAKAAAAAMEAGRDPARTPTTKARTLADLLHAWYSHGESSWSVSTAQGYRSRIKLLSTTPIAKTAVDKVTTEKLDQWYAALVRLGTSPANIRNHHALLRRALNQGVRWGWLQSNPALLATPPRVQRKHLSAMKAEDVMAVAEAASGESLLAGLAIRLAAVTGARRGELVGLQWADLDGALLTISRSITTINRERSEERRPADLSIGPTKTHSIRRLTLDIDSIALLALWRAECSERAHRQGVEPGPWIFSKALDNSTPCSPGWLTRVWVRARRRAGLASKWRLHDLRHWAATTMIASGEDVRLVAGRLGHARAATTLDVYAHFVEKADGRAAEDLASALSKSPDRKEGGFDRS